MSEPDYISLGGSDNSSEASQSPTLGKRKYKTPTPDPDSREQKRLRQGDRPSRISSGGENSSSSPLSSVPSENVPTQLGFNILQAQREAHDSNYDSDYHGYALKELKNAIERYESINPDGLLDADAIDYLIKKLKDNVNAKYNQTMTISDSPSMATSTDTQESTPPPSSDVEPENSEIDLESDSIFGKDFEKLDGTIDTTTDTNTTDTTHSSSPAAASTYKSTCTNPDTKSILSLYTEASAQTTPAASTYKSTGTNPETKSVSPSYTEASAQTTPAASTYKSTGTNPDTKSVLPSYTEASTQTIPSTYKSTGTDPDIKFVLPSYTEASTQTTPTPPPSNTELWRRHLRFIRRSKRIVAANSPMTVVKCRIRKVQKPGYYKKKPAAAAPSHHIIDLSDSPPASPTTTTTTQQQEKKKKEEYAPVTIDLSSDDEDDVQVPPKKDLGSDESKDREPPSALKVGGAGYGMYADGDGDDHDLLPPPPQSVEQGSTTAAANDDHHHHHNVNNNTTTTTPHSDGTSVSHRASSSSLQSQSELWEQEVKQQEQRMIDFYGLPRGAATFSGKPYGQAAAAAQGPTAAQRQQLRYQNNQDRYTGPKPGPESRHQLRLDAYHRDIRSQHRRDPGAAIETILAQTSWGGVGDDYNNTNTTTSSSSSDTHDDDDDDDDDDAEAQRWLDAKDVEVMRGFPLMEDVRFLVAGNHANARGGKQQPNGDCYWRALSKHLYGGTDAHWDLVKAEHLAFAYHVLKQPAHPRHALYARELNARFVTTASPAPGGSFKANLWQTLHLAHAWTPALMQQVTADLYNVCVVMFTVKEREVEVGEGEGKSPSPGTCVIIDSSEDENTTKKKKTIHEVTETTMRGSYNSRHLFLVYSNGCHYQPMIPADYYASEFQFPLPTPAETAKYSFAPKAVGEKGAREHAWRREFTASAPLPVPRLHGCDVDYLRDFMGSRREV